MKLWYPGISPPQIVLSSGVWSLHAGGLLNTLNPATSKTKLNNNSKLRICSTFGQLLIGDFRVSYRDT